MYAIYTYIDPQNHPNVGKYAKHGVSGIVKPLLETVPRGGNATSAPWRTRCAKQMRTSPRRLELVMGTEKLSKEAEFQKALEEVTGSELGRRDHSS